MTNPCPDPTFDTPPEIVKESSTPFRKFNHLLHWYLELERKNWAFYLEASPYRWALPLSIGGWFTRNNDPNQAEYDWYNTKDGSFTLDILCFQLRVSYDELGIA